VKEKPLNQKFFDEPYSFEFFQAVRLLERMYPERATIGRDSLPVAEVVRFRSRPTLGFPASEIHELRETDEDFTDLRKLEMFVNFMGMVGAIGVLPPHYTELVAERARYRDTAMWAFLDIFSHRAISLFFRAWEKYRFPFDYERSQFGKKELDAFTEFLFDRRTRYARFAGQTFVKGRIAFALHRADCAKAAFGELDSSNYRRLF